MFGPNRVAAMVAKYRKQVEDRITAGIITQAKADKLHAELDMPMDEFVRFQELKSLAVATGKLTTEEGMTIYGYLGNSPEHFNRQDLAIKSVLTTIWHELLSMRVSAAQRLQGVA